MARSGQAGCGPWIRTFGSASSTAGGSPTPPSDKDRRSSSAQKWVSHLEEEWDDPLARGFYEELAQNHLVVRYDRLGAGLSERQLDGPPTVEKETDVLRAVLDACGGVPATVFACS